MLLRAAAPYCARGMVVQRGLLLFDSTGDESGLFIKFTGPRQDIFCVVHSMHTVGF